LFLRQRVSVGVGAGSKRRYSIRKRGLEGEWECRWGRSRKPETPLQPGSRLAGRHGADHRGGGAGTLTVLDFCNVQIEPGGTPAVVWMAKPKDCAPYRLGVAGVHCEAGAPENFKRVGLRCGARSEERAQG